MPEQSIYQIKIYLDSIPSIWRRMDIFGNYTFLELHVAIQNTMGWNNNHLHEFRLRNPLSGKLECIGIPDNESGWDPDIISGEKRLISEMFNEQNTKAKYIYDFGDYWIHSLNVEKIVSSNNDKNCLQCICGEKACPPEDCGGVDGYIKLLSFYNGVQYSNAENRYFKSLIDDGFHPDSFEAKNVKYQVSSSDMPDCSVSDQELWLRKLLQGKIPSKQLKQEFGAKIKESDIERLRNTILEKPLRYRNRAIGVFSFLKGIKPEIIENHLFISRGAIDKYFGERNEHFRLHPKQAGNKIWGKERVTPTFDESKNCKDPKYV